MRAVLKIPALLILWLLVPSTRCWAACTLEVQSVLLGSYDAISANAVDGTGQIRVQCTPAADYTLSLSAGQGSYAARELHAGASVLYYNLYLAATRLAVWGDGNSGTMNLAANGGDNWHTVYGRIEAGQHSARAGTYADQVLVTVDF